MTKEATRTKIEWEQGRDHAADMFGLIRHINQSGNGAGLAASDKVRSVDTGYDYPDGQINVCAEFIRELVNHPERIEGFGAVITHLLAAVEQGDHIPDMHLIAQVPYEWWTPKGPAGEEGGGTVQPLAPHDKPGAEAVEPA